MAGDAVTAAVRKVVMDALEALPAVESANIATNLSTMKGNVATALAGWDKYAAPTAGQTGFDCAQDDPAAEKPARPADNCKDTVDAETGAITARGCCSAVIPYNADPKLLKWEMTTAGRLEVCLVSSSATPATTWQPVEFVPILEAQYSAMCIEGAMKAAAGAAAVMGSIFMM